MVWRSGGATTRLIDRLRRTAARDLLPRHVTLNVNYPVTTAPRGAKVTQTGRTAFVRPRFQLTDLCADCYLVLPRIDRGPDPVADSDTNTLAADHIAVVPLDGDWTADVSTRSALAYRLSGLN